MKWRGSERVLAELPDEDLTALRELKANMGKSASTQRPRRSINRNFHAD